MVDARLVSYIKGAIKKGYSIPKIKEILIANGQNARRVEGAIEEVSKTASRKNSMKVGLIVGVGIIAIIILVLLFFLLKKPAFSYYATPEIVANLYNDLKLNCSKQTAVKSCFAYALNEENECVQENKEYEERCRIFYNLFKAVNGEGECFNVNNTDQKLLCECITQNDKSKCLAADFNNMNMFEKEKLKGFGSKERGIFYDSIIGNNVEKCEEISGQFRGEVCRVLSAYILAVKNSDINHCDSVGALEGRDQTLFCKALVLKDANLCPENEERGRADCIKQEILNIKNTFINNPDICSMFPEEAVEICNSL